MNLRQQLFNLLQCDFGQGPAALVPFAPDIAQAAVAYDEEHSVDDVAGR